MRYRERQLYKSLLALRFSCFFLSPQRLAYKLRPDLCFRGLFRLLFLHQTYFLLVPIMCACVVQVPRATRRGTSIVCFVARYLISTWFNASPVFHQQSFAWQVLWCISNLVGYFCIRIVWYHALVEFRSS